MARNQINLNRYRKIYPTLRKNPVSWIRNTAIKEVRVIDLSTQTLTFTTTVTVNAPVIVASAEATDGNINVWVASTSDADGDKLWDITLGISDTSYTGKLHVVIGDSAP